MQRKKKSAAEGPTPTKKQPSRYRTRSRRGPHSPPAEEIDGTMPSQSRNQRRHLLSLKGNQRRYSPHPNRDHKRKRSHRNPSIKRKRRTPLAEASPWQRHHMAHAGAAAGDRGEEDHKAKADLCHQGLNIGLPCVGLRGILRWWRGLGRSRLLELPPPLATLAAVCRCTR